MMITSDPWHIPRAGICQGTFEIVSKEVLWSVRGSCQTIWGPPLPNVTRHSGWWPYTVTPSIDRTLHQFLTVTDLDLITDLTFYLIVRGFHKTFATGAACQQRTLTPPDTWSCPTLGLACVVMSRPISPELVLFPDFLSFEHPSVLLICFEKLIWKSPCPQNEPFTGRASSRISYKVWYKNALGGRRWNLLLRNGELVMWKLKLSRLS